MSYEKATIEAMISIYCRGNHHRKKTLCSDCEELLSYGKKRLDDCHYKKEKPICSKCITRCYKPEMREKIRRVMRYSGPRMMLYHPLSAFSHLIRNLK